MSVPSGLLFSENGALIEEMHVRYLTDRNNVTSEWQDFFDQIKDQKNVVITESSGASWADNCRQKVIGCQEETPNHDAKKQNVRKVDAGLLPNSVKAMEMVKSYRQFGHLLVDLDPLKLAKTGQSQALKPEFYNLELSDEIELNGEFGFTKTNVENLLSRLQNIYSNRVGIEYQHIDNDEQRLWLQQKFESLSYSCSGEDKRNILKNIQPNTLFEEFLHVKYPGAKRFSIEGGEAMIPALYGFMNQATHYNTSSFVIGMPHRGRLCFLTSVVDKPYKAMLYEFQGGINVPNEKGIYGDVKYHMGYSTNKKLDNGKEVHISLCYNPSHLEAINPVVLGRVRGKQDRIQDCNREQVAGIVFHGDAAFAGQGVVAESLSLSDLAGYKTGGVFHVVVNNGIGFTTEPKDARLSRYPTEFGKVIQAPIFHVNGHDPEAVYKISQLMAEFRAKFGKDVLLNIVCYRKYGHNEGDEPMFTQPNMYREIKNTDTLLNIYANKLISENVITRSEYDDSVKAFKNVLNQAYTDAQNYQRTQEGDWLKEHWSNMEYQQDRHTNKDTNISEEKLVRIVESLTYIPDQFNCNSKIKKQLSNKKQSILESKTGIDWGTAENIAFASLISESIPVRISGQDCKRGTFSHRHAVLFDQNSEQEYIPINNIGSETAKLEVINSNLSEFAVLGFEYGYSLSNPHQLNIWEAQFGDFANGAQIMIDQFIAAGESKWLRSSGLVMLLPHGYEGQGPEHSSARLERFLQLCADNNMQVVNVTTPAQFFHLLRRQVTSNYRKPLIVMSPKSLLRHKLATSDVRDFTEKTCFDHLIDDIHCDKQKVNKIVLCSGKVYYDLYEKRIKKASDNIALIRMEQLYPVPKKELLDVLSKYNRGSMMIWCQEEHRNMGAWQFIREHLEDILSELKYSTRLVYIGRKESASTATGYLKLHLKELEEILAEVFNN